jgi:UDP:flavonoid glycosyltransferase YjiC (YdhE family)
VRVLVVAGPLLGHAFPLVPLARALQVAGHDVLLATAGQGLSLESAGLPVEELPGWRGMTRAGVPLMLRPRLLRRELRGSTDTRGVGLIWGGVNARMAEGAVGSAERFAPDLILHEPLATAGAVAAAVTGVPAVLHENALYDGVALADATARQLGPILRRYGLRALPEPAAVLRITPASVVPPRSGWPVQPVPFGGVGDCPPWLAVPPADGRPRILVTRSTVAAPGRDRLMPAVVAASEQVEVEVVLVRPGPAVARRPMPANVRTVDWVPLPDVLPACAAVVHHGGAGTTLAAMSAGVPQVLVPGAGDRRYNAGLVETRGVGLARVTSAIDAATLRRLTGDDDLRANALAVRDEIAAMPAPQTLVPRLAGLVRPRSA